MAMSAREMLSGLPVRLANGGDARNATLLAAEQKYLANPDKFSGAELYNKMLANNVSVNDLLGAGVAQSTVDSIFKAPEAITDFQTPANLTSSLAGLDASASEAAINRATGLVDTLQASGGGIDAAERLRLQKAATQYGVTFADLQNAGINPNILFDISPVNTPKGQVFTGDGPMVYTPPSPEVKAPGIDQEFRDSAVRTRIEGQPEFDPLTGSPTGYTYTPAAQLTPATGSGWSWVPPTVTSRPRSLLDAGQYQQSYSQRFAEGRAGQDRELQRLFRETGAPQNSTLYNSWRNRLRAGDFGKDAIDTERLNTEFKAWAESLPKSGPAGSNTAGSNTGLSPEQQYALESGEFGQYYDMGSSPTRPRVPIDPITLGGANMFADGGSVKKTEGSVASSTDPLTARLLAGEYDFPDLAVIPQPESENGGTAFADLKALDIASNEPVRPSMAESVAVSMPTDQAPRPTLDRGYDASAERDASINILKNLGQGSLLARDTIINYGKNLFPEGASSPVAIPYAAMKVRDDLKTLGSGMFDYAKEEPVRFIADMLPISGQYLAAQDVKMYSQMATDAEAAGDQKAADMYKQIVTLAAAGMIPFNLGAKTAAKTAKASAKKLAGHLAGHSVDDLVEYDPTYLPRTEQTEAALLLEKLDGRAIDSDVIDPQPLLLEGPKTEAALLLEKVDAQPLVGELITKTEKTALNKGAGRSPKRRQAVMTAAERYKQNYSPTDGWVATEIKGVDYTGNNPKILPKKISYGIQNAPEGMAPEVWKDTLSNGIVNEVNSVVQRATDGDQKAIAIIEQANWYRAMRDQLRSEFGGIGDVFADVLGATSARTNVEQNFNNATEIMRKYSRGDYDVELEAYASRLKQGERVDGKTLTQMHKAGEFPLITKDSGKLFNANSPASMGALLDTFRSIKTGAAPKTPNFTGNLLGLTDQATIDVWAARNLRRLAGLPRIPPAAEQGVTGTHLAGSTLFEPKVGGEFGFGQVVFSDAATKLNQTGAVRTIDPSLGNLGPDDLQAVVWFIEKERWTDNGWTSKSGEGGSLDYEMSFAGSATPERVVELRRKLNKAFKPPAKRKTETDSAYGLRVIDKQEAFNQQRLQDIAELNSAATPLTRYTLGIAGERPNKPMSNYGQAELAAEFDDVVRDDPSVLTYNLANTYGSFMGDTERSLNAEFVVRENFDPQPLRQRLIEQGRAYDQDAVFMSRAVPAGTPNARPGVEIYFKEEMTPAQMAKVTEKLREKGVDGFTYITDARMSDKVNRQTRSGSPETAGLSGVRFQYVPEFDDSFNLQNATQIYLDKSNLYSDIVEDILNEGNVSDARLMHYDAEVYFRDDYDGLLTETTGAANTERQGRRADGANDPQPNRGGEVGAELSRDVPDGVGSTTPTKANEGIGSLPVSALDTPAYPKPNLIKPARIRELSADTQTLIDEGIGNTGAGKLRAIIANSSDIEFASEVLGEALTGNDLNPASDAVTRKTLAEIKEVTQESLKDMPDEVTVYRYGGIDAGGNSGSNIKSFTLDPNYSGPLFSSKDKFSFDAYTVNKKDIEYARNAFFPGADEAEVLIRNDKVRPVTNPSALRGVFSLTDRNAAGMTPNMVDYQTAGILSRDPNYFKEWKDVDYEIRNMSPDEYLERGAKILRTKGRTPQDIIDQRAKDTDYIDKMVESMRQGQVYAAPFLDYGSGGRRASQEGMHRALAARQLGMEEIPVMVMDSFENPKSPYRSALNEMDTPVTNPAALPKAPAAAEASAALNTFLEGSKSPRVLYSGTSKDMDFDQFRVPRNGAWFTDSKDSASTYAIENDSMGHKWDQDVRNFVPTNTASRVIPVHVAIKNPYKMTEADHKALQYVDNYKRAQSQLFDKLRAKGYDGVEYGGGVWVALGSPKQIKSAIGNKGTFDPKSPKLNKANGGLVERVYNDNRKYL